jgi:hypothetical protein
MRKNSLLILRILLALVATPSAGFLINQSPATWAVTPKCTQVYDFLTRKYTNDCPAGVIPGAGKSDAKPACAVNEFFNTCYKGVPCTYLQQDHEAQRISPPEGPKPQGANAYYRFCGDKNGNSSSVDAIAANPNSGTVWLTPAEAGVNLMVEAQRAMGAIKFPKARIATSPALITAVGFDTHWWAEGIPTTPVKGSSALGLVATATPVGLVINPGGEETELSCPWTTTEQATTQCTMMYQKSSIDGPATYRNQPAHTVSLRTQWKLSFTFNGTPITISNVPDLTNGPTSTATLSVAEIQSLVGPNPTN